MLIHARRLFAAIAIVAVAVALAACGSDSKPATTPSPATRVTPSPAPGGTVAAPSAIAPGATPTAALQATPDPGLFNTFTIDAPAGWTTEDVRLPGGFGRRYVLTLNGTRTAQISINCQSDATIDAMVQQDSAIVTHLGGTFGSTLKDVTVGGIPGKEGQYTVPLGSTGTVGGPDQQTRVIYLIGSKCGWHILLQTFGAGLARYNAEFDAALATFKPSA